MFPNNRKWLEPDDLARWGAGHDLTFSATRPGRRATTLAADPHDQRGWPDFYVRWVTDDEVPRIGNRSAMTSAALAVGLRHWLSSRRQVTT